jgi:hypothetical protein
MDALGKVSMFEDKTGFCDNKSREFVTAWSLQ